LEGAVTDGLTQAAQNGSLGASLGSIPGGTNLTSSNLSIGTLSGAGSSGSCQTPLNDPTLDTRYYPDIAGESGMCKNDGFPPAYIETFYDTLEECCRDNYGDMSHICTGNTVDWYPSWAEGDETCLNDADRLPDYMTGPFGKGFLEETLEKCCTRWFKWNTEGCINDAGGTLAYTATNKWYVHWDGNHCVQDCLVGTGDNQYGLSGLNCGGLATSNDLLYATLEECCFEQLAWISSHKCEMESLPPPAEVRGTSRWYVSYELLKCVQDCSVGDSPSCGGIIKESHVSLFPNPQRCCEDKLNWLDTNECTANSMHENNIIIGLN